MTHAQNAAHALMSAHSTQLLCNDCGDNDDCGNNDCGDLTLFLRGMFYTAIPASADAG